jgi:hypothetical protein
LPKIRTSYGIVGHDWAVVAEGDSLSAGKYPDEELNSVPGDGLTRPKNNMKHQTLVSFGRSFFIKYQRRRWMITDYFSASW